MQKPAKCFIKKSKNTRVDWGSGTPGGISIFYVRMRWFIMVQERWVLLLRPPASLFVARVPTSLHNSLTGRVSFKLKACLYRLLTGAGGGPVYQG